MDMSNKKSRDAFTILELIIVIVIIGIIAAIIVVAYRSVVDNAIKTSLVSDLVNASDQIKIYQADNGQLPTSIGCPSSTASGRLCVNVSSGNEFIGYHADNAASPKTFQLSAHNGEKFYYRIATGSNSPLPCPVGFVIVPGSKTYGTNDFCTMKYEAKKSTSNVPESTSGGMPWVSINQSDAIANSNKVKYCDSCHLMKEAEWMTIAQNVLQVKSNWSGGAVGDGYIYSGHNDGSPSNALASSTDDDGYAGTGNNISDNTVTNAVVGKAQKRTLIMTNGEIIWDLAGNASEWSSGQTTGGQPGLSGETSFNWKEWPSVDVIGGLSVNPNPDASELAGSSGWNSSKGIGQLCSNINDNTLRGFIRGGAWAFGMASGVLTLYLDNTPSLVTLNVGFRVSR